MSPVVLLNYIANHFSAKEVHYKIYPQTTNNGKTEVSRHISAYNFRVLRLKRVEGTVYN